MFKKIAVAFDESAEAQRAFRAALNLATLTSAELFLVTVIENLPAYMSYVSAVAPDVPRLLKNERQMFYEDLHSKAKDAARRQGIGLQSEIAEGDETEGLLHLIEQIHPDLLVVGLRWEPGGLSQLLGGTAHRLALHASCDVLGIR